MLSIIISSYKPANFKALKENIDKTCGIVYEIIKIDNPGLMGITEAYNLGAKKAKYNFFLFLHEDIIFHTDNWGEKLISHHHINNLGVIGIAGGTYIPSVPSGWFTNMNYALINILQREYDTTLRNVKTFTQKAHKAIAIDGVFISISKDNFYNYSFDEKLKGYHGYDTELSLRVAKKHQNYVVSDILIEHFSPGNPDKLWFINNMYIRKKHRYNFNVKNDEKTEMLLYKAFTKTFFTHYKKSFTNYFKVLQFLPISRVKLVNCLKLIKFTLYSND